MIRYCMQPVRVFFCVYRLRDRLSKAKEHFKAYTAAQQSTGLALSPHTPFFPSLLSLLLPQAIFPSLQVTCPQTFLHCNKKSLLTFKKRNLWLSENSEAVGPVFSVWSTREGVGRG